MKRRDFLCVLGGAAVTGPLAARAQQTKVHVIGILGLGNPDPAHFVAVVREELAKLGYADGRNCRYEVRSAEGNAVQLAVLATWSLVTGAFLARTWNSFQRMEFSLRYDGMSYQEVGQHCPLSYSRN
jgi:hypothetical protein